MNYFSVLNYKIHRFSYNFEDFSSNFVDLNLCAVEFTEAWLTEAPEPLYRLDSYDPLYNSRCFRPETEMSCRLWNENRSEDQRSLMQERKKPKVRSESWFRKEKLHERVVAFTLMHKVGNLGYEEMELAVMEIRCTEVHKKKLFFHGTSYVFFKTSDLKFSQCHSKKPYSSVYYSRRQIISMKRSRCPFV